MQNPYSLTIPLIVSLKGSLEAEVYTFTVFEKAPVFAALYLAVTKPCAPGAIAFSECAETVQPQVVSVFNMVIATRPIIGKVKLFTNRNALFNGTKICFCGIPANQLGRFKGKGAHQNHYAY